MATFYVRGRLLEYLEGHFVEAEDEKTAIKIYEENIEDGLVEIASTDIETWNEMQIEE